MADPNHKWPDMTFRTREVALTTFDTGASEVRAALAGLSDADLAEPWKFSFGEHIISDAPRSIATGICSSTTCCTIARSSASICG